MPIHMIRKLSLKKKDSFFKEHPLRRTSKDVTEVFSHEILSAIIDKSELCEQIKMRSINRHAKEYVDGKLHQVKTLDVRKTDISETCISSSWSFCREQVAIKIEDDKVFIVVDTKWTSKDIQAVVGLMEIFRENIEEATIDAPIAELLVVSLSALDLNRWYAFQCYMKAVDGFEADMHLGCCPFSSPRQVRYGKDKIYWPKVRSLTIRTTEKQATHLARVIDYGVQGSWVLDRQMLESLRIEFVDLKATSKVVKKHIYHFRCWAGSAGFDHRFQQKFKATEVLI